MDMQSGTTSKSLPLGRTASRPRNRRPSFLSGRTDVLLLQQFSVRDMLSALDPTRKSALYYRSRPASGEIGNTPLEWPVLLFGKLIHPGFKYSPQSILSLVHRIVT